MNKQRPPWTDKYKQNWDDAYENMMAWWSGESLRRPVILTPVMKPDFKPYEIPCDPGSTELRDLHQDYQFEANRRRIESMIYPAESVPAVRTGFASSIGMIPGMAGAKLVYSNKGTVWINEEDDLYAKALPVFSPDYPPYRLTIELMHRHAEYYGYDCIIGSDAMMDPMTILSMMRGVEKLCYDFQDEPESVKIWLDALSEMRFLMAKGYMEARLSHGRSEEINWTSVWAPGEMDSIECDFSTMLSPEMFEEFVMPEVEREASYYDYCLWHLDGLAEVKHLEAICSVKNMYAIQWVTENNSSPLEHLDLFRKIRKLKRSLLINCQSPEIALELTKQIGKDGLALTVAGLNTEGDMEKFLRKLEQI